MSETEAVLPETIPFSNEDIEAFGRGTSREYAQLPADRWFEFQVTGSKTGLSKNGSPLFKLVVQPVDGNNNTANTRCFLDLTLTKGKVVNDRIEVEHGTMENYLRAVKSQVRCKSRWDKEAKVSRDVDGNVVSKAQHLKNKEEYGAALFQECNIRRWKDPTIFLGERFYGLVEENTYNGKVTTRINVFTIRAELPDAPVEREQFTQESF